MNNENTGQDTESVSVPDDSFASTTEAQPESAQAVQPQPETAPDGSSTEESFFDPATVPDELKPAYKQMQAAFTKKTQEIASARKEMEQLQQKAQAYSKYEQYVPILDEMLSSQAQNQQQSGVEMAALEQQLKAQGYEESVIDLMKMTGNFLLSQFQQKQTLQEQQREQQRAQQTFNQQVQEAGKLDPRLSDQSLAYTSPDGVQMTFSQIVESLIPSFPEWQKDVTGSTKKAIALVDAMLGQARTAGKEELSSSAQDKARKFPSANPSPQSATDTSTPRTMKEAAALARKQLGY